LLDKKGIKFRNNMLGQTIALALNTRLLGNLGSFTLTDDPICTQAAKFVGLDGGTPVFEPDSASLCGCGGSIPSSVITALGADPTVHGLLNLANRALAGLNTAPASLGDIHSAVGLINESFDECRSTCGLPQ
jgi:hypothetical protein